MSCVTRAAKEFLVWDLVRQKVSCGVLRVVCGLTLGGCVVSFWLTLGGGVPTLGGFSAFHSGYSNLNLKMSLLVPAAHGVVGSSELSDVCQGLLFLRQQRMSVACCRGQGTIAEHR